MPIVNAPRNARNSPGSSVAPSRAARATAVLSKREQNHLTVRAILFSAAAQLSAAGVASPRTDAELLAAHALGIPRGRLLLVDSFTDAQLAHFRDLIEARSKRIPLQHLVGTVPVGDLDLAVGPGVFVPRPETDLLIAWALSVLPSAPVVADFCSGSGAIALAVAHARPDATVYAVERDPAALDWLRRNANGREAAGDRAIEVVAGDVTDPATLASLDGTVDALLCNPPYVPDGTFVPTEVSFDPHIAVFGGTDGLAVVRPVVERAVVLLKPGGVVAIEHDDSHGQVVPDLLAATGEFLDITARRDLADRPRFTTALRRS